MARLKAGVIGTGMGRLHMEDYAKNPEVEIVALCDLNKKEAEEFAQKFGAKLVFTDYKEMFKVKELDLVSIAVPNFLHAPMSIAALEAGKHVLCEKPMSNKLETAIQMVNAAKAKGKRLMINMSMRFIPAFYEMKEFVDTGILGYIYYGKAGYMRRKETPVLDFSQTGIMGRGNWFVEKEKAGGGALMDIGVHCYDLAWWMMGIPKPVSVLASTYRELSRKRFEERKIFSDVDDLATALVKFDTGATLAFEVSWDGHMPGGWNVQLYGDKAGMSWTDKMSIFKEENGTSENITVEIPKQAPETSYQHFISAVLDPNKKMMASGEECINVMKVLDGIDRSARDGGAVNL